MSFTSVSTMLLPDGNDDRFDPNFPSGVVDDNFDTLLAIEDADKEDDGYWISVEQQQEIFNPGDYSQATDWKDISLEELNAMVVTIDKAR